MNDTPGTATEPVSPQRGDRLNVVSGNEGPGGITTTGTKVRQQAFDLFDKRKDTVLEPARALSDETERFVVQLRERGQDKPAEALSTATRQLDGAIAYVAV